MNSSGTYPGETLHLKNKEKQILWPPGKKDHIADKEKRISVASNFFPATFTKQEQKGASFFFKQLKEKKVIAKDFMSRQIVLHLSEL